LNQVVEVHFKKSRRVHDSEYSMIEVKIFRDEKLVKEGLVDLIQMDGEIFTPPHIDCRRDGWFRIWTIKDAKITGSVLQVTPRRTLQ